MPAGLLDRGMKLSTLLLALTIPCVALAQKTTLEETDKIFSEAATTDKWIYNDLTRGFTEARTTGGLALEELTAAKRRSGRQAHGLQERGRDCALRRHQHPLAGARFLCLRSREEKARVESPRREHPGQPSKAAQRKRIRHNHYSHSRGGPHGSMAQEWDHGKAPQPARSELCHTQRRTSILPPDFREQGLQRALCGGSRRREKAMDHRRLGPLPPTVGQQELSLHAFRAQVFRLCPGRNETPAPSPFTSPCRSSPHARGT